MLTGLGIRPRRPVGSAEDVEDLRTKWQSLLDLGPGGPEECGHDYECPEWTERNAAVNNAIERVSKRQERQVFHSLTDHQRPFDRLCKQLRELRGRS